MAKRNSSTSGEGEPRRGRRRRWPVVLALLGSIEALAVVAEHRWSFRVRLLTSFDIATRAQPGHERPWHDMERLFDGGADGQRQSVRFRLPASSNPVGNEIEPDDLPPGRRVVVLGESAAFGVGCRSEETFAALLDERFKSRGVRVLNAGQVGADAWQVLDAGAQILNRYAPSALVVFTGNNLWIDWTPPQQKRWNPRGIRILSALATSRAIAALEFVSLRWILRHTDRRWRIEQLARFEHAVADGKEFHDHHELSGSRYALDHPLEETPSFRPSDWPPIQRLYLRRFEASLELLVRHAQSRRVGVALVTMPFNYRLSPAWKHPQFEAIDPRHHNRVRELLKAAGRLVQAGDCPAALPLIEQALALDPEVALLHYLQAQCLQEIGRAREARAAYARSRECMIGNLGSSLSVNEVIRAVGARLHVPVLDAVRVFDQHGETSGRWFSEDLILDDCHPSPTGHRLLAEALAPLLEEYLEEGP